MVVTALASPDRLSGGYDRRAQLFCTAAQPPLFLPFNTALFYCGPPFWPLLIAVIFIRANFNNSTKLPKPHTKLPKPHKNPHTAGRSAPRSRPTWTASCASCGGTPRWSWRRRAGLAALMAVAAGWKGRKGRTVAFAASLL